MSDENMSAEEAAELVGPWHPEVDGRAACLLLPRLTSTVVNLHAEVERRREQMDAERAVFDAFADLQRVKLESARAEVARLRRALAVEGGDESQAPNIWQPGPGGWRSVGPDGQALAEVDRDELDKPWGWVVYIGDDRLIEGEAATALDAMEAADKALGEVAGG